jgi:hypothetical protein
MKKSPFIWKNVHFVDELSLDWENPKVCRYMPFSRVCEMLKNRQIAFVSPELWDDPFEKRFYDVKVVKNKDAKPKEYVALPNMACLCFTSSSSENAEAFWSRSKTADEPYVRVVFDLYELLDALNSFADKHSARIYVAAAKYEFEHEIKNVHKKWKFTEDELEHSYVRLMSLKRKAFSYEQELRLFIVWDKEPTKIENFGENKVVFVSYEKSFNDLIKRMTFDPRLDSFEDDENSEKDKNAESKYEKELKQILDEVKLEIKPDFSGLYSGCKCREIELSK